METIKFTLIPDWNKKNLQCDFCGTTKSVKYEMEIDDKATKVCVCNKCVILHNK